MQKSEPVYFGLSERSRAGWLHRAATSARTGVVICNPFGYEWICSHRTLRRFADAFAEAGLPTLRFDYDGTGDSAGDDRDPARLDAWVESTRDAITTLREHTGVERVYLVGVRLGVLIAALASAGREDVAGLVAVAPVISGKSYLRELAVRQTTLQVGPPPDGATVESLVGEGAQEAFGFVLTKETRAALGAVNLAKTDQRLGGDEILVLDRDDLPAADPWLAKLSAQGVTVDARKVPGYVEMMLDPHKAIVPLGIVDAAKEWLGARAAAGTGRAVATTRREATFGDVVEEMVFVDDAKLVFGVLSRPRVAKASKRALLLLNAGSIHHVGPNRLHVTLARQWAAAGHEVLRLDITGIGESRTRDGLPENLVYNPRALQDTGLAIDLMRRRGGRDVRPIGLCSGAYHAFKSAVVGQPVSGFVAINPLFYDEPPAGNTDFPTYRVEREVARYQGAVRDVEKWKKLLRGEVRVRAAAETLARHAAGRLVKRARDVSRRLNLPWRDDVGVVLEGIAERSIAQHYVFAQGDPGNKILHDSGGHSVAELQERGVLAIEVIEGCDHTFTPIWSHKRLFEVLDAAISTSPRPARHLNGSARADSF